MSTFTKSFCNEMDRNIDSNRHNRYTFIQITVNTDKCIDCVQITFIEIVGSYFDFDYSSRKRMIRANRKSSFGSGEGDRVKNIGCGLPNCSFYYAITRNSST